jgi:thiamine biosynthesis lipoprotein ApbE/Na+-translocating ferredoxin:NAD+ oxidoreductase RnfG subunit
VIFGQDVVAKREVKNLTDAERKALEASSSLHFPEPSYTFYVVQKQGKLAGYALVLDEIGKSEPITFMVGMSPEGKVIDVAVMVFRETRGWEVKEKRFLRQFRGKRVGDPIQIDRDIINYSGATLSSRALARGAKRALSLLQRFYPPTDRPQGHGAVEFVRPAPLPALDVRYDGGSELALYRQARYRMGTICEIRLWTASTSSAMQAFEAGFREIARLDRMFSNYRDDSELAHVNGAASKTPVEVSPEFWDLTRYALRWWKRSRGTFDITVAPLLKSWGFWEGTPHMPSPEDLLQTKARVGAQNVELMPSRRAIRFRMAGVELDFGGLAKGYAAERAARLACHANAASVLVNLGGSSLSAAERHERHAPKVQNQVRDRLETPSPLAIGEWPVVISSPGLHSEWTRYLVLQSGWSFSTSASSEQSLRARDGRILSHIIDPRTGLPIEGPCSAAVLARSALHSELLTKPLLLLDAHSRNHFVQRYGKPHWAFVQLAHSSPAEIWQPTNHFVYLTPVS